MFGRVDLCDFVLEHPTISRFHAGKHNINLLIHVCMHTVISIIMIGFSYRLDTFLEVERNVIDF